jgi:outer membrane receptor protein involved in Fe transport
MMTKLRLGIARAVDSVATRVALVGLVSIYPATLVLGAEALEEIVVTSTRQASSANRVPLAVTAQTQLMLDQKGINTISDLAQTVPGLRLMGQEASGVANVAIRGVRQTSATAATTGFYLDETPLHKRAAAGFGSQNGTPVPPLFDLERVEVLRGPQGTLFGGGSEGGTIRYIQPQPSLTDFSAYMRSQYITTRDGDPTYEAGFAAGGPIVDDKLGFRASIFTRNSGGYIDLTDYRTGAVYQDNANDGEINMGRLALSWAPSDDTLLTVSYFKSTDETSHNGRSYNLDIPGVLTVPSLCYDNNAITAMPVGSPGRSIPSAFGAGPDCNGRADDAGVYIAPGYTIGPLDLDEFQSLALGPSPTRSELDVATVDFKWNIRDGIELRSITSWIDDLNTGQSPQNFHQGFISYRSAGNAIYQVPGENPIPIPGGVGFNPNVTSTPNGLGLGAYLQTNTNNAREVLTQEFRLTGTTDRLTYVVGSYFAKTTGVVRQVAATTDAGFVQLTGLTIEQRFGVPNPGFFASIFESIRDVESAVFADITYQLTDNLSISGGVRITHVTTDFEQTNYGPNGYTLTPSLIDGTLVKGEISDSPITPKLTLEYQFSPDQIVYATAAKGFRAGGVNQVFSSAGSGQLFGQYGLPKSVLPVTYDSDSVWSYELGAKIRLWDGRAQLNAAAYRLEWDDVQTNVFVGGDGFVVNVPTARSEGVEFEAQLRPVTPLTFNIAVGYGTAEYTSEYRIPGTRGFDLMAAQDGQQFSQPDWTVNAGVRYDLPISAKINSYARLDYTWFENYQTAPLGASNYTPDSSEVPSQKQLNLRIGVDIDALDINFFVYNLTDEDEGSTFGGRSACTNAECSTFNNYNIARTMNAPTPRQIGLQAAYRY